MSKNLRPSSAGSLPRAIAVRRGALSLKTGALFSLAGAMVLSLAGNANAQAVGGPATLSSTLTATTTSQVLNLTTSVTQNSPSSFTWSFTLTNPTGNTVQIRSFTVAPRCDLSGAAITATPPGWTQEVFAFSPQVDPTLENNKVNWFVPNTSSTSIWLQPGQTKTYAFVLSRGADPTFRGFASALDTFGFSGETLGCPPPPPPPGPGGGGQPGPGIPVRQHGPFYIAQAYPAIVQTYDAVTSPGQGQIPQTPVGGVSGISPNNCFLNGATQAPNAATTALPGILCLDRNVKQVFNNPFAICGPGETNPRVQAVTLSKIIPGSFKCDAFGLPVVNPTTGASSPAQTLFQDVNHLRTWWTLRYTQPGTKFVLDVVVVCTNAFGGTTFHIDRWVWIVAADVRTFPFVVDLLHQDAVGTFEIPCIVAEDVVSTIRSMFANFQAAVQAGNRNGIFNGLIDLEAYIAFNCLIVDVAIPEQIFPGTLAGGTGQTQTGGFPTYQPPGNQAVLDTVFGSGRPIGILDTFENPCCCKLLADLEFIGQQLGISFGPHTFLNGKPI